MRATPRYPKPSAMCSSCRCSLSARTDHRAPRRCARCSKPRATVSRRHTPPAAPPAPAFRAEPTVLDAPAVYTTPLAPAFESEATIVDAAAATPAAPAPATPAIPSPEPAGSAVASRPGRSRLPLMLGGAAVLLALAVALAVLFMPRGTLMAGAGTRRQLPRPSDVRGRANRAGAVAQPTTEAERRTAEPEPTSATRARADRRPAKTIPPTSWPSTSPMPKKRSGEPGGSTMRSRSSRRPSSWMRKTPSCTPCWRL